MEVRMVACDSSTKKTGMSLYVNGDLKDYVLIDCSKNKEVNSRIEEMGIAILKKLDEWNPSIVWTEHPQGHGSNVDMVSKLSKVLGIILGWTLNKDCTYDEKNPSEWRKLVGLNQGGKTRDELKQMSIGLVKELHGIDASDDVCDSILLGQAIVNYFKEIN